MSVETTERRRRADGERSREKILQAAAELATLEGINGISIGRLADAVGMSKSGLYAHFRSKEELQLATVETASRILNAELEPGMQAPEGKQRIIALCDAFFSHVQRRVFPGGCFFASGAAELSTQPGRVRDAIATSYREWNELLEGEVRTAQAAGEIAASEDPGQLVFELNGLLVGANVFFLLFDDEGELDRGRRAVRERLENSH